jgi:hypothetical protein
LLRIYRGRRDRDRPFIMDVNSSFSTPMVTLEDSKITLNTVRDRLGYQAALSRSFDLWLDLLPLSAVDEQQIEQLQENFQRYLLDGRVLEGQVRLLAIAPLLQLSGFYDPPNRILVEESIETIQRPQDDCEITGRFDLVVVNPRSGLDDGADFWILLVESKESQIDALAGLPQLLTYAYTSLPHQSRVWGLTTNGVSYRFVLIEAGEVPTYHLMPELNLIDRDRAFQILQVLRAIGKC